MVNETILTLEHVMERLDAIDRKMLTKHHMEIIHNKMHNFATNLGSKDGDIFKLLKERGTLIHERIEESPSQIDKLEETFSNLRTAFSTTKIIEGTPVKSRRSRNKGATSSNNDKEDLKMISIHPNFVEVIRDPFCKNEIFKFTPRSIAIEGFYAKTLKDSKCSIEESDKDDKT